MTDRPRRLTDPSEPEEPQGVYLILPDGEEIACLVIHTGWHTGCAVFEAMPVRQPTWEGGGDLALRVDVLPPATQIVLAVRRP